MVRLSSLLFALAAVATAAAAAAPRAEIDSVYMRFEGIKERCLAEDLLENTVLLVKHSAHAFTAGTKVESPFQLLTSVRDTAGHTVTRQQSKPADRLFLTAPSTGVFLVCFQAMHQTYAPNVYLEVGLEVFIGDAGDHTITSPMEAHLTDVAAAIGKAGDLVADVGREQALQREREALFREKAHRVNADIAWWAVLQVLVLGAAAFYQVHHMRRFFRAKKLV